MEGDLNLSQMLGGLRIANQTDDSPPSSPIPSHSSTTSNNASSQIHIPDLQTLESQTAASMSWGRRDSVQHGAGSSSHSLPLLNQSTSAETAVSSASESSYGQPPRSAYPANPSSRHSTQFVSPSYTSSTSPFPHSGSATPSLSSQLYPDYSRLTREPSRSSLSGPSATGSHTPRPAPRDRAQTERPYRASQTSGSVKKGVKDFNFGRTLGEGSYSTVVSATDRTTLKEYAIKILDKRHIIKEDKVKYVNIEKNTLNRLGEHPGVVRLYYTFQDERSLFFVLDLATGGELLSTLKRLGTFDEECTRYYAAQILDTVEYMHSRNVIHRDLKPENVLLDDKGRIKITDFGTAKILDPPKKPPNSDPNSVIPGDQMDGDTSRANSFVGTAEYVSPELLSDRSACKASDLWAFGCMVFQLLAGRPPFKATNEYLTFKKILDLKYEFPPGFPAQAKDLVERLLVLDPARRLNIEHIKNHPFFDGVEWGRKLWKIKAPRLKPYVAPPEETKVIKLNDFAVPSNGAQQPKNGASAANGRPAPPRVITELPPPSQLDIEWSPVLTRPNERILKLGNATVQTSPAAASPDAKGGINGGQDGGSKKFSRFFGGGNTKKRARLVLVTSAARVIVVPAESQEKKDKKAKVEINLQGLGVVVRPVGGADSTTFAIDTVSAPPPAQAHTRSASSPIMSSSSSISSASPFTSSVMSRRSSVMSLFDLRHPHTHPHPPVDKKKSVANVRAGRAKQRDKCYTFDAAPTPAAEWLAEIERAREIASVNYPANEEGAGNGFMPSTLSSPASTLTLEAARDGRNAENTGSERSNKRFSKRTSRHGLAAVF